MTLQSGIMPYGNGLGQFYRKENTIVVMRLQESDPFPVGFVLIDPITSIEVSHFLGVNTYYYKTVAVVEGWNNDITLQE